MNWIRASVSMIEGPSNDVLEVITVLITNRRSGETEVVRLSADVETSATC